MLPSRTALILNFTGNTYHWGCFGTAYEIYQTLLEREYAPSFLSVRATHILSPTPQTPGELVDPDFIAQVTQSHPLLQTALAEADLVVINGEGTLHGFGVAARNLLSAAWLAKNVLKKRVHLINHSSYPSDSRQPAPEADAFYAAALRNLDCVVAREIYSHEILLRLGVRASLGFDCLPRFIIRHGLAPPIPKAASERKMAPLLISGGVDMPEHVARTTARSITTMRHQGQRVLFLTGAKQYPAGEDITIFEWMREEVPDLILVTANSFQEWAQVMAEACCLISARFHHTIAAVTLGTPVIALLSRTPRLPAIAEMLDLDPPISYDDSGLEAKIIEHMDHAIANDSDRAQNRRAKMLSLGEENFRNI